MSNLTNISNLSLFPELSNDYLENPINNDVIVIDDNDNDSTIDDDNSLLPGDGNYTIIIDDDNDNDSTIDDDNSLLPGDENDTIIIDDGELIEGTDGDDSLYGHGGNDTLIGGSGNDYLDGGSGQDTADYSSATQGIHVDLERDKAFDDGFGYQDTLRGVDNIIGSSYDDSIMGDHGWHNELRGGDGNNTIDGGTHSDTLYGEAGDDSLRGGDDNDILYAGSGKDTLNGGNGNDKLYAGKDSDLLYGGSGEDEFYIVEEAASSSGHRIYGKYNNHHSGQDNYHDTLVADYSETNTLNTGIQLRYSRSYSAQSIWSITSGNNTLVEFADIDTLNIKGTRYNDVFQAYYTQDYHAFQDLDDSRLEGGDGDDLFIGQIGTFSGGLGIDTLQANFCLPNSNKGAGIHVIQNEGKIVNNNGVTLTTFDAIEVFNIRGTIYADTLEGGAGDDVLTGVLGDDVLRGGAGNDTLFAFHGSNEVHGGAGDDYIYTVSDTNNVNKDIWGGEGADTFIVDLKGSVGLAFDFNVQTLANFVNDVTLPENEGIDWERMGVDIGFSAFGAVAGSIPFVGGAAAFMGDMAAMGVNAYLDQQEVEEQIAQQQARSTQAVQNYNGADWGSVTVEGQRDTVIIRDFNLGLDTLVLPKLYNQGSYGDAKPYYTFENATLEDGTKGVYIKVHGKKDSSSDIELAKDLVFIANNYDDPDIREDGLKPSEFTDLIMDLQHGAVIGTFNSTSVSGTNNSSSLESVNGTFANDRIFGDSQPINQNGGGNDEIKGHYGDDIIHKYYGDDIIFGGLNLDFESNPNSPWQKYEDLYGNDGNDSIDGGMGNDTLYGETGDDYLLGGEGADRLIGGAGADRFAYNALHSESDVIEDFDTTQGDKIVIKDLSSYGLLPSLDFNDGVLSVTAFSRSSSSWWNPNPPQWVTDQLATIQGSFNITTDVIVI